MESEEEDWEMVDYNEENVKEEEEEEQKWWWRIGKKVVMAGVVISSAPVVIPPLLVVSALGFTMSLPFGVVFATYACTHNLMSKLLPMRDLYDDQLELMVDAANANAVVEKRTHDTQEEEEEEEKMSEDMKNEIEMRIELVDSISEKEEEEPEIEIDQDEDHHYLQLQVAAATDMNQESLSAPSDPEGSSSSCSSSSTSEEQIIEDQELGVVLMNDDAAPLQKHHDSDAAKVETAILDHHIHRDGGPSRPTIEKEEDLMKEDHSNSLELKEEKQRHQVNNCKIWEKINAIREIVGFKAPRRSSYTEELKALFLFTGIEPPASASSSSEDKLCFLMSVIGLK